MQDVRTDGRQTREDRATQPMDAGWLSFAVWSVTQGYIYCKPHIAIMLGTNCIFSKWWFRLSVYSLSLDSLTLASLWRHNWPHLHLYVSVSRKELGAQPQDYLQGSSCLSCNGSMWTHFSWNFHFWNNWQWPNQTAKFCPPSPFHVVSQPSWIAWLKFKSDQGPRLVDVEGSRRRKMVWRGFSPQSSAGGR